ncbi:MAG: hypothetical protein AAGG56_05565 [Pseudomonadota bacterium]
MNKNNNGYKETNTKAIENNSQRALTLDVDLYQSYLDESDLTDDEKQAFLEALWNLVVSFVQLGFGVHPAQDSIAAKYTEKQEQNKNNPSDSAVVLVPFVSNSALENTANPVALVSKQQEEEVQP